MKLLSRPVAILACAAVTLSPLALASSSSAAPAPTAAASTVAARSATTLKVTLPKVINNGWLFNTSARLVRSGGVPVAGQVVTFTLTGTTKATRKAVTDRTGTARVSLPAPWYGRMTVNASFPGSRTLAPSKAAASRALPDPERG